MKPVFEYLDYRDFLKDHYDHNKKNRFFSFRYIAVKTGIDASLYAKILNKQRHISTAKAAELCDFLKLKRTEKKYFELLVRFNRAKTTEETRLYFEKMLSLRDSPAVLLEKDKYDYFLNWYNAALRDLIKIIPFTGDYNDLARRLCPEITEVQAKKSVQLLEKLGLIFRDSDGVWRLTDDFIRTDGKMAALAVRSFQKEMCRLGMESIERIPKEQRDISTITVSSSKACMELIRERLADFRREILQIISEDEGMEEVYQLNFQVFPLTCNKWKKE
ncbi:MAG TPA: TIGR02147 family protein [Chitinispirillaceae bacterium]|nr:TIGR02147 family protein [Chitinispirillaceae bacterium]